MSHQLTKPIEQCLNKAYLNAKGNTECVEFIKRELGAPATRYWREGKRITRGDLSTLPGTAIATFVDGGYPQAGDHGKHAAIYLGQDSTGIQVLDQWRAQGRVKKRTIKWNPTTPGLSNNGNAYSEIEW